LAPPLSNDALARMICSASIRILIGLAHLISKLEVEARLVIDISYWSRDGTALVEVRVVFQDAKTAVLRRIQVSRFRIFSMEL